MARIAPGRRGWFGGLAGLAIVAAAVALVLLVLPALVPSLNPFKEETQDRSQPPLLQSLENLSQFRAASANLQVVVDVERDAGGLPDFIKGERTLFIAAGSVDAAVDFTGLSREPDAVQVSADRRRATLLLPAPRLTEVRLDPARSRVYDRDRGILDRIGDAVGDNPTDDQPVYLLAERKLREAAAADPQILATAQRNTRAMLQGLLRGLGFDSVTVRFRPAPV